MIERTERKTSEKGLAAAVAACVSPGAFLLRWLGERALEAGLSQEELAKRLNAVDCGSLTGANVAQHFASRRPSKQTLRKYAAALGYNEEFVELAVASPLSAAQIDKWRSDVRFLFESHQSWFRSGAFERIEAKLQANPAVYEWALRQHGLASLANLHRLNRPGWMLLPADFYWFGEAALAAVDIRDEVTPHIPQADFLYDLFLNANALYENEATSTGLVQAVAAILKLQGYDTSVMFERMEARKSELRAFRREHARRMAQADTSGS